MTARRIALFGFYGVGNFGDDLMAWMIAMRMHRSGHAVSVFSVGDAAHDSLLGADFARQGIESSRSIDQALDSCAAVIYGGGGILAAHSESTLKQFRRHFDRERRFLDAVTSRTLPLAVVSIGGDGSTDPGRLDPLPKALLGHAAAITVRNPSDVVLLRNLGVASIHAPDIVWGARRMLDAPPRSDDGLRIGLDLYPSLLKRTGGPQFLVFLQALILRHRTVRFVCLDSRHASAGFAPGIGHLLRGANVSRYRFNDYRSDAAELSSLDLLISSRLHVPMLALQYGVPFVSVFAEAKTHVMLENTGLAFAAHTADMLPDLRAILWDRHALERWIAAFRARAVPPPQDAWQVHFQELDRFLKTSAPD